MKIEIQIHSGHSITASYMGSYYVDHPSLVPVMHEKIRWKSYYYEVIGRTYVVCDGICQHVEIEVD